MELYSIVVARNLGIGKKDREQIHPSVEKFLKKIIDMNGLDLSNTINVALENHLREKQYLTPEALEILGCISDLEKNIFENGIESTASDYNEKSMQILVSRLKESVPQS
ncbi:hypothetical protein [Methanosarcina mazei]|uniref:Uncharacterized protein n=3 Tax=Methanosarcina mazei TaxID=2209 RepID=A0A0F8MBA4_METMZ|nr:hypothetical protein [Methanosarcina mazei]AKB41352.1 hypothetical protein MSMAW_2361 [Methanosarcina mazei WWM610]AKB70965.1 hypothetical protein MSMAC_1075 [Methanosarcina mazei C16]KKG00244.1 hypothetical protein DU31_07405 [Methanosarcina mazei]KKG00626.1 hypothetical protein DU40_10095 [Methanosarcina mazei]KKG03884.1 hypothetical protein DU47_18110 [Methanosarcina mazei]